MRFLPSLHAAAGFAANSLADEPREISGIYPHLDMYNQEAECGTGAVVPWAGKLWSITYAPHKHELVASEHFAPILESVMRDAGADFSFSTTSPPLGDVDADLYENTQLGIAPSSRHIMGTCRMGDDPATSVVDRFSRFHDVENLVCADSSVFVTSTGYNPTLSLVALAHRAACGLAGVGPAP